MRLRGRMISGFGVLILIMLGLGATAVWQIGMVKRHILQLANEYMPRVEQAAASERAVQQATYAILDYQLSESANQLGAGRDRLAQVRGASQADSAAAPESAGTTQQPDLLLRYTELVGDLEARNALIAGNRAMLELSHSNFTAACHRYFDRQLEQLTADGGTNPAAISPRLQRILRLVEQADGALIAAAMAQVRRDTTLLRQAQARFQTIKTILDELKAPGGQKSDEALLLQCRIAKDDFKNELGNLAANWTFSQNIGRQSQSVAGELTDRFRQISQSGVNDTTRSVATATQTLAAASRLLVSGMLGAMVVGLLVAFSLTGTITRPLAMVTAGLRDIAQGAGDLTRRLPVKRRDEIGELSDWFNQFVGKLQSDIRQVGASSGQLADASTRLSGQSVQIAAGSGTVNEAATAVAAASAHLSDQIQDMAATTASVSTHTRSVTVAVEEMKATVDDVARNCTEASQIAQTADRDARAALGIMDQLEETGRDINTVVEVINRVAEQTNLLALNATIEAATAGEAGRGFAVVAGEVKELARQSAQSAHQITERIQKMLDRVATAGKAMRQITEVIGRVSQVNNLIAAAFEEQSATNRQIAGNIAGVSDSAESLSRNARELAQLATEVSGRMSEIQRVCGESATAANAARAQSEQVAQMAGELSAVVSHFKT